MTEKIWLADRSGGRSVDSIRKFTKDEKIAVAILLGFLAFVVIVSVLVKMFR